MPTIQISGYPLEAPLTFEVTPDVYVDEKHWLLNLDQAEQLCTAWRDADTEGADDIARAYIYSETGTIITALHMEHEVSLTEWESAQGCGGDAVFSTAQLPFEFDLAVL